MIKLKVSEKEKFKDDGKWFKDYLNESTPLIIPIDNDYQKMLTNYKIVNNDLSDFKEQFKNFCNPLSDGILDQIDEEILPYPEIYNSLSIIKGEVIQRKEDLHVSLLSANAIREKNEKLQESIRKSIDEKLALDMQKMDLQDLPPEEVDKIIKERRTQLEPEDLLTKNFLSEVEIFYNKSLRFCSHDQNLLEKKVDTITDLMTSGRMFIYSGWKNGRPYLEVRNPLHLRWRKSPNEKYIHKSDWICYQKAITLSEAIQVYNLSEDDIARLQTISTKGLDKRHELGPDNKFVFDKTKQDIMLSSVPNANFNKRIGLNQDNIYSNWHNLVWETHFEFKAFKDIVFLSYIDEYNEPITITLDGDFEIPKTAKKEKYLNRYDQETTIYTWVDFGIEYKAEIISVPRRYEIVRLGSDVYPIYREVPYQVTNIEHPFESFELSTKGVILDARNSDSVSPVQRAIPPYLQFLYLKHIFNRELSKYQGAIQSIDLDQIPDDLGKDLDGNLIRDKVAAWLAIVRKTNKDFYSGSQNSAGGLPPATRSPGSGGYLLGTAVELMNLHQLSELVRREISMSMGISPERQAAFQSNTNVTDNQRAIQQSYSITEPYFFLHALVWKDAVNDWLSNFRTYCETQLRIRNTDMLSFQYWLPGNIEEILEVTPKSLSHSDIGLFLMSSSSMQEYSRYMLENLQAFAQNQGSGTTAVSQIIKDIVSNASPEEIHKRIQIEERKSFERQSQLQEMEKQHQLELEQMRGRQSEQEFLREKELIVLKEEQRRITELQKASIQATLLGKQEDANNNDIPDSVDMANLLLKERQLDLKEKEMGMKHEIDKEKIKVQRSKK